jgi:hypothetical protein
MQESFIGPDSAFFEKWNLKGRNSHLRNGSLFPGMSIGRFAQEVKTSGLSAFQMIPVGAPESGRDPNRADLPPKRFEGVDQVAIDQGINAGFGIAMAIEVGGRKVSRERPRLTLWKR